MTMDYSPWLEREIWPFLKVAISPKSEKPHPPKFVYMHVTSIPTCMNFLSQFQLIKFFDDHGVTSKVIDSSNNTGNIVTRNKTVLLQTIMFPGC